MVLDQPNNIGFHSLVKNFIKKHAVRKTQRPMTKKVKGVFGEVEVEANADEEFFDCNDYETLPEQSVRMVVDGINIGIMADASSDNLRRAAEQAMARYKVFLGDCRQGFSSIAYILTSRAAHDHIRNAGPYDMTRSFIRDQCILLNIF